METLLGKSAVVTGANVGIGLETARELARLGATVTLLCRSREKGEAAVRDIQESTGNEGVGLVVADLARMAEVRRAAGEILDRSPRLEILVNNAGVITNERRVTPDGFETMFAVNHLAPFLLTNLLKQRLIESAPARVVTVASAAHRQGRLRFDDLQSEQRFSGFRVYGTTKLANILFTRSLARRLADTRVVANCCHPGVIASSFGRDGDAGKLFHWMMGAAKLVLKSPAQGARTSVWLATAPEAGLVTGQYCVSCKPARPYRHATDDEAAERLWEESARLVGLDG